MGGEEVGEGRARTRFQGDIWKEEERDTRKAVYRGQRHLFLLGAAQHVTCWAVT